MGSHNLGSVENHVLCSASSVLLVLLLLPHRNLLWCLLATRLENNSTPLLIKTTMRRMSCTSLAIYDCHYVDKIVYKDECVPYVEKTCYTQQEEHCEDMFEKNCTAVIDEFEERECFEVTELQCQLSESIQYEVVQESYTVLRCTRTSDRVCDTVYDLAISTRMTSSALMWSTSTAGTRRRSSRIALALTLSTLSAARVSLSTERIALTVTRCRPKSATTRRERSGRRCASPGSASTARSSPTSSLTRWRNKTATASR